MLEEYILIDRTVGEAALVTRAGVIRNDAKGKVTLRDGRKALTFREGNLLHVALPRGLTAAEVFTSRGGVIRETDEELILICQKRGLLG